MFPIFLACGARDFKFGTYVVHSKRQPVDDKPSGRSHGHGRMIHVKFCGPQIIYLGTVKARVSQMCTHLGYITC